jgi:hypothetical protein
MAIDLRAAESFLTANARPVDRRRFAVHFAAEPPDGVLAALDGYRNRDGGYGWGLEPDLRARESQPGGALHAFEVFAEIGPATSGRARQLCDWLQEVSLADGGLPFARAVADTTATAPFWADADHDTSSLHITAAVAAMAHRVARHDPAVADHPWLARVTSYCLGAVTARDEPDSPLELLYTLGFLDAVVDVEPAAASQLARWAGMIPPSGSLHVDGGAEDEFVGPLHFSPWPDRPVRAHLDAGAVAADLECLAGGQRPDGGWVVDFAAYSPAAALEWRGYETIRALMVLEAHGLVGRAGAG